MSFRALVLSQAADRKVSGAVETLPVDKLPAGDVTVAVEYSTLNYKDAPAITGKAPVVRQFPMVPGIDFAGAVHASENTSYREGDRVLLNGHPEQRLPNTLNVNFVGNIGAQLLQNVPEIAASTGSACHEGAICLSPVLEAMGVAPELGRGAVRLSVGRYTNDEEVDRAAEVLAVRAKS